MRGIKTRPQDDQIHTIAVYLLEYGEGNQAPDAQYSNLCSPSRNAGRQNASKRVSHSVPSARNTWSGNCL